VTFLAAVVACLGLWGLWARTANVAGLATVVAYLVLVHVVLPIVLGAFTLEVLCGAANVASREVLLGG